MSSPDRFCALFDILTHHESYSEIIALGDSQKLRTFGSPLQDDKDTESTRSLPLLHALIQRFILYLPGLRDVDPQFWKGNIVDLLSALADSGLSESQDRGTVGLRKQVSTFITSLVEEVSRGTLGGFAIDPRDKEKYSLSDPEDLEAAFNEFIRQSLHGDMIPELVSKISQTQDLADHSFLVQAAHKYAMIMTSSSLHYMLIHAPQGQYILDLLKSVHNLIPYFLIRQTLRVGNVATMISGMVKIVLAKMSMSSLGSWFGASSSGSGMNLLQYIISTVLDWDISALRKKSSAIENDPGKISKIQLDTMKAYAHTTASDQKVIRLQSINSKQPLTQAILNEASVLNVENEGLETCERYLSAHLAITDREKLIKVLCRNQPDLLTGTVRTLVTAYEPVIRALHQAADLSGSLADLQIFLTELIALSGQGRGDNRGDLPTVEDYHGLLNKHVPKFHKFLHEACMNSAELKQWYQTYATRALSQYRQSGSKSETTGAAGDFTTIMEECLARLSAADRALVETELDQHFHHMISLRTESRERLDKVVRNLSEGCSGTQLGPGIYLAKWLQLMQDSKATNYEVKKGSQDEPDTVSQDNSDIKSETKGQSQGLEPITECPVTVNRLIGQFRNDLQQSCRSKADS